MLLVLACELFLGFISLPGNLRNSATVIGSEWRARPKNA
jgi:hypothetical protein